MSVRNTAIRILSREFSFGQALSCYYSRVPYSNRSGFSTNISCRHYVSAPAASKVSAPETKIKLPDVVTKNLGKLKYEVLESLLDQSTLTYPLNENSSSPAPNFTKNLRKMAEYYFNQGGKLFRPTAALIMACACNQLKSSERSANQNYVCEDVNINQYKIAVIAEMIHTASLIHDDVIDESDVRRGSPTVNALWGNKMAVLVGDFILARATQILCSIGRPNVISVMALIIEDLVKGEFMQMTSGGEKNGSEHFDEYMAKTYSKTASLFANSCKSAAMLADLPDVSVKAAFEYGRSLGLAFQLVDDMLDFISTSSAMGKPTATDLKLGLATAPVLFAAKEHPELSKLISRRFSQKDDVSNAWKLVLDSDGLEKTRNLAKQYAQQATDMANHFPNGDGIRDLLTEMAVRQLDREK